MQSDEQTNLYLKYRESNSGLILIITISFSYLIKVLENFDFAFDNISV